MSGSRSLRPAGEQTRALKPDLELERVGVLGLLPLDLARGLGRGTAGTGKRDVDLELGVRQDLDLGGFTTGVLQAQAAGSARARNRSGQRGGPQRAPRGQ